MQVVSWPVGYIQLAKGKGKVFVVTEIVSSIASVLGLLGCLHLWKLEGIGISVALSGLFLVIYCVAIGRKLSGFAFSRKCLKVSGASLLVTLVAFFSVQMLSPVPGMAVGLVLAIFASLVSLRRLQHLLQVNIWQLARQKLGFSGGPESGARLV